MSENYNLMLDQQKKYKICQRCVMDTSDPDIEFDDLGNCNHCNSYFDTLKKYSYQGESSQKQWLQIVDKIKEKGKGRRYDCLMGVSGGVDSSYAAYLAKQFDLRVLLLHMDNGWDTEVAVKNIKAINQRLGFDYISNVLDWEEFREVQLAFLKSGVVDLETPTDIAISASLYKTASKYDIKYIIFGCNLSGEGILPMQMGYHKYKDMYQYNHIVRTYSEVKMKTIPRVGYLGEIYFKFVKNIKNIYILNYFPFDKNEAKQFLIDELGWIDYGGIHHESKITAFWQSYVMPLKYNMDYRRTTFASQICEGQITREVALEELKKSPYDIDTIQDDIQYIAKKFGITTTELENIVKDHPRTFKDFPNQKEFIDFIYSLYRKIFSNRRI